MVGLYLSPPENALVLAVDEKSQMQALDRTAPILPIMPGTPARMTHTYVRHGTTSLFAALDISSGSVIAQHYLRHRHQEFLGFLKTIDKAVPANLDLHLICDNYATHKTDQVQKWLLRHPRFHIHFTPTSASWLNLVDRWFAELTRRKLRRSAHIGESTLPFLHDLRFEFAFPAPRGTLMSTSPAASDITVFDRVPFRTFVDSRTVSARFFS